MTDKVNLGCGPVFVADENWINYDYVPSDPSVKQADLLDDLPIPDNTCDAVYSSHFLEHIPLAVVPNFLGECYRILCPGGFIRLVLPDFEEMCTEYLNQRKAGNNLKADFVVIQIIDQCVRTNSGGRLGDFYQKLRNDPNSNTKLINYVKERNGEDLIDRFRHDLQLNSSFCSTNSTSEAPPLLYQIFYRILFKIKFLRTRTRNSLQEKWFNWLLSRLPDSFVRQNVSFASVGERHHWLWDFHQLQNQLISIGFINIQSQSCNTSSVENFPFFPLDISEDGSPRKGCESMYVEAQKPY